MHAWLPLPTFVPDTCSSDLYPGGVPGTGGNRSHSWPLCWFASSYFVYIYICVILSTPFCASICLSVLISVIYSKATRSLEEQLSSAGAAKHAVGRPTSVPSLGTCELVGELKRGPGSVVLTIRASSRVGICRNPEESYRTGGLFFKCWGRFKLFWGSIHVLV